MSTSSSDPSMLSNVLRITAETVASPSDDDENLGLWLPVTSPSDNDKKGNFLQVPDGDVYKEIDPTSNNIAPIQSFDISANKCLPTFKYNKEATALTFLDDFTFVSYAEGSTKVFVWDVSNNNEPIHTIQMLKLDKILFFC